MLSVDSKGPGKFSKDEISCMVDEWRKRVLSTNYCIQEGLVVLDESFELLNELKMNGKDWISPCVKREQLVKLRGAQVLCG